jgi:hypothetical protein
MRLPLLLPERAPYPNKASCAPVLSPLAGAFFCLSLSSGSVTGNAGTEVYAHSERLANKKILVRPSACCTKENPRRGGDFQCLPGERPRATVSLSAGWTYIMSMPPMPPMPPGIAGASSFGSSATMQSVVSIRPATEAAFCRAERVTLVGSSTPISTMSP